MIIAWPSWTMWIFVVWMVVNIFWIVIQIIDRFRPEKIKFVYNQAKKLILPK